MDQLDLALVVESFRRYAKTTASLNYYAIEMDGNRIEGVLEKDLESYR
ncbi:MAG TPA: hypothetical protein VK622_14825 [Puia sp.]|nr:hypothetical protein [Puia sp.]